MVAVSKKVVVILWVDGLNRINGMKGRIKMVFNLLCSRNCIEIIAKKTGKPSVVLPF